MLCNGSYVSQKNYRLDSGKDFELNSSIILTCCSCSDLQKGSEFLPTSIILVLARKRSNKTAMEVYILETTVSLIMHIKYPFYNIFLNH
jgi:hypothetical protein